MLDENTLNNAARLHFVGVGGSGMFPLVQILLGKGHVITGSDNNDGDTITQERAMGVAVTLGHDEKNVEDADMVVYSAAIPQNNPELLAAKRLGIPLVKRADMLGYITRQYGRCVCVSGTHGKTTVTAMLTQILVNAQLDPAAVIGGKLKLIGGSGRAGKSDIMTCEACEFQDTFLSLSPDISIILNIDEDHLDYFKTLDNIITSFRKFAESTTKTLIVNGDDANTLKAVRGLDKNIITFGNGGGCDYRAENITRLGPAKTGFTLTRRGERLATLELNIPGGYNVLNAVAACAAALELGVTPAQLKAHLPGFTGAGRRFEILGKKNGVTIMDDYAHHPAELKAALTAVKEMGYKKVWAVFQPFTYSRTKLLLKEHAEALAIADRVVMSEIMGGREENTYGIYTKDLAALIPGSVWFPEFPEIAEHVMKKAEPGDIVLTLGCGDIYKCAKMMLK